MPPLGLVSITFRRLEPPAIVELVQQAGLTHVEWGGDVHCPHGDADAARRVGDATRDGGLTVAVYGSYYRCGVGEGDGLSFDDVLASAVALRAPAVRVWAGDRGREDADEAFRAAVVADARRIADRAGEAGLRLVFEYHAHTLTDTHAGAVALLDAVDRPNARMGWQPVPDRTPAQNAADLDDLIRRGVLGSVHAFHWTLDDAGKIVRHPLADGAADWALYVERLTAASGPRGVPVLVEFVKGDDPRQFAADAAALRGWFEPASFGRVHRAG